MSAKLKLIITFVVVGILIPLMFRLEAVLSPRIILITLASITVFLTQPGADSAQVKANKGSDQNSFWWIMALSILALHAPIFEWAYINDTNTVLSWSFLVGTAVLLGSLVLRVWSIQVLGKYFTATVQIVDQHQIVQSGPYAYIRHPSYTGAYFSYFGVGILLEAWIGLAFSAIAMGVAYYIRIKAEEATLLAHFGSVYSEYSHKTKRLIPFVF